MHVSLLVCGGGEGRTQALKYYLSGAHLSQFAELTRHLFTTFAIRVLGVGARWGKGGGGSVHAIVTFSKSTYYTVQNTSPDNPQNRSRHLKTSSDIQNASPDTLKSMRIYKIHKIHAPNMQGYAFSENKTPAAGS